jgi:uncharacterized protein
MTQDSDDIAIHQRKDKSRYELEVGGKLAAFADYRPGAGQVDFVHTEVLPGYEGRGIASRLVRHALDDTRRQRLKLVPTCSFFARYIQGHPEYQDLVVGQNPA